MNLDTLPPIAFRRDATCYRRPIPLPLGGVVVLLSFALVGCPGPPDLAPKQLSFDSNNVLEVTLEN
jgi:hypothetical protein